MNSRYNKLQHYAVKGRHSDVFKPYLYSRTQRVELKFSSTCNYSSTWKTIKCGVPQRSVLGPLLFGIYIDGEPCTVDNSTTVIMYTDNRSILTANTCYEELNRNFKDILYNTITLLQASQLVLFFLMDDITMCYGYTKCVHTDKIHKI